MKMKQSLPVGAILRSNLRTYKVVEILGSGTFGVTYKVVSDIMVGNVEISTFFAIKECFLKTCYRDIDQCRVLSAPTELQSFIDCKKDFIKEAKLLNKLSGQSKHIVQVNEVFEYNDTAYYVMKYLDGGDLESYIKSHGAMSESQALDIIKPIIMAIDKLHEEKLLHLDIKPSNIMLMNLMDNQPSYPVLIDFGIAKHFSSKGKPTSALFAKGASDGYAPMEQYASIPVFTPQIDIYALAATLLHFITGKQPPTSFKLKDMDLASIIPASISPCVRHAIRHAMAPQSAMRTPSAAQFLKELEGNGVNVSGNADADEPEDSNKTRPLRVVHMHRRSDEVPHERHGASSVMEEEPATSQNEELRIDDNGEVPFQSIQSYESDNPVSSKESGEDKTQSYGDENTQGYSQSSTQGYSQDSTQSYLQGGNRGYNPSNSYGNSYPHRKARSNSGTGRKILIFTLTMIICLGLFIGGRLLYKSYKHKENQEKLEKINQLKEATRKVQEEKHDKEEKIKAKQDSILKQDSIYKSGYYSAN